MMKAKKLLSLLLTLALVLALVGGSFAFADEEEPAEPMPYSKAEAVTLDEQVLLVVESEGKALALGFKDGEHAP